MEEVVGSNPIGSTPTTTIALGRTVRRNGPRALAEFHAAERYGRGR
jgi:hypothetical protein